MSDLKPEHRRRFVRLVDQMNQLVDDVRGYIPEAQLYLANDNLHLMSGDSHSGVRADPHQERSMESRKLHHSGGGDW